MPLMENSPYTNFESLNLDWILQIIKELELRVKSLETRTTAIEQHLTEIDQSISDIQGDIINIHEDITDIQTDITNIYNTIDNLDIDEINRKIEYIEGILDDLDIEAIWSAIETNNNQSIARDDDLSRRISLLEQATINPINIYTGTENLILWGSDFRQMPSSAKDENGYPIGAPCGDAEGRSTANMAVLFDDYGYTDNPSGSGYTYLTLGRFNDVPRPAATMSTPITVTLGFITGEPTMTKTPIEIVKTFVRLNDSFDLASDLGASVTLRLDYNSNDTYITLDIRGSATNMHTAFTNRHLCYCRVEYGTGSSGVRFNNHDSKVASLIAQASGALTPTEVETIVHDNLQDIVGEEIFNQAYNVTLTPADGSASYSISAELDLRLTYKLGFLSGILALNIPLTSSSMTVDLSKMFDMTIDVSALDLPGKTILADTIHFFSDLFTGAQFDCVLKGSLSGITQLRFWGAMRPIVLEGEVDEKKTVAVIKIYEPCVWSRPTPS